LTDYSKWEKLAAGLASDTESEGEQGNSEGEREPEPAEEQEQEEERDQGMKMDIVYDTLLELAKEKGKVIMKDDVYRLLRGMEPEDVQQALDDWEALGVLESSGKEGRKLLLHWDASG